MNLNNKWIIKLVVMEGAGSEDNMEVDDWLI